MTNRKGFVGKSLTEGRCKMGGASGPSRSQEGLCPIGNRQMSQGLWPGWALPQGGGNTVHVPHQTGSSGRSQGRRQDRRKLSESRTRMAWVREKWQPGRWFLPRKHWVQLQAPDPHCIITSTQLAASPVKAAGGPPPCCPQARPMSHEAPQPLTLCPGLQPSSAGSSD